MQSKTIKKILRNKIDAWIESIGDKRTRELMSENVIVTGGAIVSMFLNEKVNDFDIYLKTKEAAKAISEYYVKEARKLDPNLAPDLGLRVLDGAFDSLDKEYNNVLEDVSTQTTIALESLDEKRIKIFIPNTGFWKAQEEKIEDEGKFKVAFISSNAITLTDQIQIVIRFHGSADEIHNNYDFIHATNYFDNESNKLITNTAALESILTKQLKYSGSLYPVTSVIRSKKFIKRGWNIGADQYLKMCYQISLLDLSDPAVLEEQLAGVDVAYFSMIISILKDAKQKDPLFLPTFEWITTVLDRVFGGDGEDA